MNREIPSRDNGARRIRLTERRGKSSTRRTTILLTLSLIAISLPPVSSNAQDGPGTNATYIGGDGSDYRNPANWNPAGVPDNNLGGAFDVFISGQSAPRIEFDPVRVDNLTVNSSGPLTLRDTTLTVNTRARIDNLDIGAVNGDAGATLPGYARGSLTLSAETGRTITLRPFIRFVANSQPLTLSGPGTIRILGETDEDLLAEFFQNDSTFRIAGGHTFRRVNADGVFEPGGLRNNSLGSSQGFISVLATSFGETTLFEAGYVRTLGRVEIDGTGGSGATATLQVIDPDFTIAASDITLRGPGARFVDQNGDSALADLTRINAQATLSIEEDHALSVAGPFTNNGQIRVIGLTEGDTRLTINGLLENIDANGVYSSARRGINGGGGIEIRTGVSQTAAVPTATLQATGANVVSIGRIKTSEFDFAPFGDLVLAGPGARFVDETGQNALRNLASVGYFSFFEVADGLDYVTPLGQSFANGGSILVTSKGVTVGANVLTYDTSLTFGGTLANLVDGGSRLDQGSDWSNTEFVISATPGSSATLRIPGADIVTLTARLTLDGPDTLVEDTSGQDALRNLATLYDPANPFRRGTLRISGGRVFSTAGDFYNGGRNSSLSVISEVDEIDSAFIINGSLAQQIDGRLVGDYSEDLDDPGGAYTLLSRFGGTATLQFRGANVVTNEAFLRLTGPGSSFRDENGLNGLRNLAGNRGFLTVEEGQIFTTAGNFTNEYELTMRNRSLEGTGLNVPGGTLFNFQDTTFTVSGDLLNTDYATGAPDPFGGGKRGQITVEAGGASSSQFIVHGTANNQGLIRVESYDEGTAAFIVEGNLANFDPTSRTLTGGTFFIYRRGGSATSRPFLQFVGADIVTNEAVLSLSKFATPANDAALFVVNENGQSGLRNFAVNGPNGRFSLSYTTLITGGSFTNSGLLLLGNSATLTLPSSTSVTPTTLTNSGTLRVDFNSGTIGDPARLTTDVLRLNAGVANLNGRVTAREAIEVIGGEVNLLSRSELIAPESRLLNGSVRGDTEFSGDIFSDTVIAPSTLASPSTDGTVSISNHRGTIGVSGSLTLGANSVLDLTAGGPSDADRIVVAGAATLGGILRVTLIDNYTPAAGDTLTILSTGAPINGAFSNVASGERLATADGRGDFVVNYAGASTVTLSSFVPDPTFTPTPTPSPSPGPSASPSPNPTASPSPTPGNNPGPGDGPASTPPASRIAISLQGKKKISTTRGNQRVRGTAFSSAGISRVVYRIRKVKRPRLARGTTRWRFNARLQPGVNVFRVYAIDTNGRTSPILRIRVRRESPAGK